MAEYEYPDGTAELKLLWSSSNGVQWSNTLHATYLPGGPIADTDLAALAAAITSEVTDLAHFTNVGTVLEQMILTDMSLVNGGPYPGTPRTVLPGDRWTVGLNVSGEVTGDPLPTQVALETLSRTASSLRRFLGKNHWGGLSESDQDGVAGPDGDMVDNWFGAVQQLRAAIDAIADWQPSVISYRWGLIKPWTTTVVIDRWRTIKARVT